jgi:predicted kinase
MLITLGGLPGVGKTTLARELARQLGAVHVRIDSIEQVIRESCVNSTSLDDAGYRIGYAIAADNLRIGRTVIADCVNPLPVTRDAWIAIAQQARVGAVEIEIICSDSAEHRHRVETRTSDIPGLRLPTWEEVTNRDYAAWDRERVVLDTANCSVEHNVEMLRSAVTAKISEYLFSASPAAASPDTRRCQRHPSRSPSGPRTADPPARSSRRRRR